MPNCGSRFWLDISICSFPKKKYVRILQTFGIESENIRIKQYILTVCFDWHKHYFPEKNQDTKRANEYV